MDAILFFSYPRPILHSPISDSLPNFTLAVPRVDVVVEALARRMNGMNDAGAGVSSTTAIDRRGGEYSSVANDEAWLNGQPMESVLLFHGADVSNSATDDEGRISQRTVVHCDECQSIIEGRVYCCKNCFDYDLCGACYPVSSLAHADGRHDFSLVG
jgi:hypothetical protein